MSQLTASPAEIDSCLSLLAATPERIAAGTTNHAESELTHSPDRKTWSALQILSHLRACDAVWSETIYAMLLLDEPTLPLIHPRALTRLRQYTVLPFADSLKVFTWQRQELLAVLRPLPLTAWQRTALIGNHRHSVFSQARRLALHESQHCVQIEALFTL
ncbi:MAG: hypothetical protein Fur0021_21050 [Candidatus Promineifilaceae bacterium]